MTSAPNGLGSVIAPAMKTKRVICGVCYRIAIVSANTKYHKRCRKKANVRAAIAYNKKNYKSYKNDVVSIRQAWS